MIYYKTYFLKRVIYVKGPRCTVIVKEKMFHSTGKDGKYLTGFGCSLEYIYIVVHIAL